MKLTKFSCLGVVGRGTYGQVWRVEYIPMGETMAIKMIRLLDYSQRPCIPKELLREAHLMLGITHENIVKIRKVFIQDNEVYLVMLHNHFYEVRRHAYPQIIKPFLRQLLRVVAKCHELGVMRRDLEPMNILMDVKDEQTLKIVDFGLVRACFGPRAILYPLTEVVGDDRISQLPDDIISFILSFLNLRDAVKTRLLSRRWRFLSSSTSNLHFDLLSIIGIDCNKNLTKTFLTQKSKFLMGVDQFLQLYTNSKIDTFHVTFGLGNDSASHIDRWISFALGMNTATISLDFTFLPKNLERDMYNFPCHLIPHGETCSSLKLKHLHLKYCTFTPSLADCAKRFKFLTTLHISYVTLDQYHLDNILSGCLNLGYLLLRDCCLPHPFRIFGPLPQLKSLLLLHCMVFRILELNSLEKLETFEYIGNEIQFKFINLPALENVYFNIDTLLRRGSSSYVFTQLAKDFPKLKILSLEFHSFEVPAPERMPAFKHLKQLEFSTLLSWGYDLLTFVNLLNASPALEKFHLALLFGGDTTRRTSRRLEGEHRQLKEVEISGFANTSIQMELVRYLFNNCISLELMTVNIAAKLYLGAGNWKQYGLGHHHPSFEVVRDLLLRDRPHSNVQIIVR